jgi:hypothetical protein
MKHLRSLNEDSTNINENNAQGSEVSRWVYFGFNYPSDFIQKVWENEMTSDHMQEKFDSYYNTVGTHGVMNKFWAELDAGNRAILEEWVKSNYNPF